MTKTLKSKFVLGLVLITFLIGFAYGVRGLNKARASKPVGVGTAIKQDIIQRVTISGTVEPKRKTLITAPYKGYVRKIYIKLGSKIKTGDPIASVGTTLMMNDQVFPLRAPFDGKVVQVNKEEGEFIKESDTSDFIARIDDLSEIYIESEVPEMDRLKVKVGQEAVVKASAILDRTYKGIVRELSLAARQKDRWERSTSVEFPLKLQIMDPDEKIQSGMTVLIDIITFKKEDALTLRHEYIQQDEKGYFVIFPDGNRKEIKVGVQNEEVGEILEGLKEGDIVKRIDFAGMIKK